MTDWQFTYRQDGHLFLSVKGRELGTSGLRKESRQGAEVRAGQSGSKVLQNIDEETVSEKEGRKETAGCSSAVLVTYRASVLDSGDQITDSLSFDSVGGC